MGRNADGPQRARTRPCAPTIAGQGKGGRCPHGRPGRLPLAGAMLALLAQPAWAGAKPGMLQGAGAVEPPRQYQEYCQAHGARDPGCHPRWGGALPLDQPKAAVPSHALPMAVHWHRQVVKTVTAKPDKGDRWSVASNSGQGMSGDCDDVVVTTIAHLLRRGVPRAALRATIVRLPGDEGHHLVLAVRTEEGEVFLDDRSRWPLTLADALARGYAFVAQEVPGEPFWQRLRMADGAG